MSGNIDLKAIAGQTINTAVVHGQKTVTTAGTEVALGSSTPISMVYVKALAANTGDIYVGSNPVTSSTGYVLDAGESVLIATNDVSNIYIDSSVNGEGVSWIGS